jgi:hypothetical protein
MAKKKDSFLLRAVFRTKTLIAISVIVFAVAVYFAFSLYSQIQPGLSPGDSTDDLKSLYLIGLVVSLFAFLIIQVVFFVFVKKLFESLSLSNQQIIGDLSSLEQHKADEIKELVTTRNMLLMKMSDKKKS